MKINSVLVTGGAGYVGAVLIPKLLKNKFKVTVIDTYIYGENVFNEFKNHPHLKQVKGDIRNKHLIKNELQNVDAVIHLACISNDPSYNLNPIPGKAINYDATIHLVDTAKTLRIKRFIFASSSSVYGVKKENEVTEDLPLSPLTDYSKYKSMSEEYLLNLNDKNFSVLILRPATVCGYSPRLRLDLTVNMLTLQALVNKKITVFGGSQTRPNIHIEDMTDLYVKSLEYPDMKIAGKIYNAGYENHTILEIAQMIKKVLKDSEIKIEVTPTNDLRSYRISSEKIKKELKFTPRHSIEDAIIDLMNAYEQGKILDPISNDVYYNIKMLKRIKIPLDYVTA